jgi:hypothetical protein
MIRVLILALIATLFTAELVSKATLATSCRGTATYWESNTECSGRCYNQNEFTKTAKWIITWGDGAAGSLTSTGLGH